VTTTVPGDVKVVFPALIEVNVTGDSFFITDEIAADYGIEVRGQIYRCKPGLITLALSVNSRVPHLSEGRAVKAIAATTDGNPVIAEMSGPWVFNADLPAGATRYYLSFE
jgi:hypothetical protein